MGDVESFETSDHCEAATSSNSPVFSKPDFLSGQRRPGVRFSSPGVSAQWLRSAA